MPSFPEIDVTSITEQELQKPGAMKLLLKRLTELENENAALKTQVDTERSQREGVLVQFHGADSERRVLEERLSGLTYRNAVCQTIWGALAIDIGLVIDFAKSQEWVYLCLGISAGILLGVAVYLASRVPKRDS